MSETPGHVVAREARLLLRASRAGTLATASEGQPFASLVTPATAPDGSALMLLSDLSEHTRHLRRDPRCAVMVAGAADGRNAQTAPRLTLTGVAAITGDKALRTRWIALHPYAAFYAGFGDFNLWQMRPGGALFVGGFARAHRLGPSDLAPTPVAVSAVEAAEPGVIEHCNADHPDALDAIAQAEGLPPIGWRMVACDVDGFDLARNDHVVRIAWPRQVDGAKGIRSALVHLAGAARNRAITTAGPSQPGQV